MRWWYQVVHLDDGPVTCSAVCCLSAGSSICLLYVYLFVFCFSASVYLRIRQCLCLFIYLLNLYLSVYLSLYLSIYPFLRLPLFQRSVSLFVPHLLHTCRKRPSRRGPGTEWARPSPPTATSCPRRRRSIWPARVLATPDGSPRAWGRSRCRGRAQRCLRGKFRSLWMFSFFVLYFFSRVSSNVRDLILIFF